MKNYSTIAHFFNPKNMENKWDTIKQSICDVYECYDKKIYDSSFTIIGPLDIIKTFIPEDAVCTVANLPDIDLTIWNSHVNECKVTFIGKNDIKEVVITFSKEGELK